MTNFIEWLLNIPSAPFVLCTPRYIVIFMKKFIFSIGFTFIATVTAYADIYKCINSEGLIIFKDSACGSSDTLKIIKPETPYDKDLDYEVVIDNKGPLGKNLLLNSSFEKKLVDWRVPLGAFWSNNGGVNKSGALVIQAKKPPEDKYIHETKVQQCVQLGAGEKFGLYANFRHMKIPEKRHANRANVVWYESSNCTTGGQYGGYIEPKRYATGWQELGNRNLKPALGSIAAMITIVQRGRYSNGGQGIWDNIIFTPTEIHNRSVRNSNQSAKNDEDTLAKGENYLLNSAFNKSVESWRHGRDITWSGIQGDRKPGSAKVDAISKTGSIGSGAFSQCVNIGRNVKFVLGGSFKRDEHSTQKGDARLRLTWYGGKNCSGRGKTSNKSKNPEDIEGWQKLKIVGLRPPYKAQSAIIEIIKVVSGKGKFTAYWDDIYFKAVD